MSIDSCAFSSPTTIRLVFWASNFSCLIFPASFTLNVLCCLFPVEINNINSAVSSAYRKFEMDLLPIAAHFRLYKINYYNIICALLIVGWSCGCQRAVDGDRWLRRHDISQDCRSIRPRTELLEAVWGHELPETRGWGRGRQDAPA